jgi:hypothetical protein
MIKLGTGYGSAFTFFDGKDLWNGVWVTEKEAADAKIYRVDLGLFDKAGHTVTKGNAADVVKIPIQVQGAAIDKQGNLWMSASQGETVSRLYRVDRKTGACPRAIRHAAAHREHLLRRRRQALGDLRIRRAQVPGRTSSTSR